MNWLIDWLIAFGYERLNQARLHGLVVLFSCFYTIFSFFSSLAHPCLSTKFLIFRPNQSGWEERCWANFSGGHTPRGDFYFNLLLESLNSFKHRQKSVQFCNVIRIQKHPDTVFCGYWLAFGKIISGSKASVTEMFADFILKAMPENNFSTKKTKSPVQKSATFPAKDSFLETENTLERKRSFLNLYDFTLYSPNLM